MAPATGQDNNRFYYLGAMYTFHDLSASWSYSIGKNSANSGRDDFELISAGLGYKFTPFLTVTSGFYYLKDCNVSANQSDLFAVGAEYSLSRSSLVYVQVGHVNNRGNMSQTILYGVPVPETAFSIPARKPGPAATDCASCRKSTFHTNLTVVLYNAFPTAATACSTFGSLSLPSALNA